MTHKAAYGGNFSEYTVEIIHVISSYPKPSYAYIRIWRVSVHPILFDQVSNSVTMMDLVQVNASLIMESHRTHI